MVKEIIKELFEWIEKEKPFGFVHRTAPINYCGEPGLLVWDYIIWNEITFVDNKTKFKQSLYSSFSDKILRPNLMNLYHDMEYKRIIDNYQ